MELQKLFLDNLRRRRKELGLTQQAMADKLGMQVSNYNRLENDGHSVNLEQVQKICKALGIPAAAMLMEHQEVA